MARKYVVIGAGFTGLAAAYQLSRQNIPVTVLEKADEIGGLAAGFEIGPHRVEKFYHHFLSNDQHIFQLIKEMGCEDKLLHTRTRTGVYSNDKIYHLSTPFDVLKFKPLSFLARIRLGLFILRARRVRSWRLLENITAEKWLKQMCGKEVYRVVWEPLLRGKFGAYASEISAAWFWKKVVLRGSSRGKIGREMLAYYDGGFTALANRMVEEINSAGGTIETSCGAEALIVKNGRLRAVETAKGTIDAQVAIATPALPIIADLAAPHVSPQYLCQLRKIKYLASVCLVLEMYHSLSEIYWLNVNDPDYPFIGLIEHTNFQAPEASGGRHIIYLSQYLRKTDELYHIADEQVFEFALPHIKHMFPMFDRSWVHRYHVYRAQYSQPVVGCGHGELIPESRTPVKGLYIATMAQIYPEDRGVSYAVREGRRVARMTTQENADTQDSAKA